MLSVALCTYNGARYLSEQLESIAAQSLLPDELIISDDGSGDATLDIANGFARKAPFAVRIMAHGQPLGVRQNFAAVAGTCQGNYVAFSDQDDVWLPDKLARTIAVMRETEAVYPHAPILVHSDLCVVDEKLNVISPSMMAAQGLSPEGGLEILLAQNFVTGCTMVANRQLLQVALPFPTTIVMHDWWLALIAAALGHIGFLPEPTIYYRQHGDNSVGAKKYISLASAKKVMDYEKIYRTIAGTVAQAAALSERLQELKQTNALTEKYLTALAEGDIGAIYHLGIKKQGFIRNMFFYAYLLTYKKLLAQDAKGVPSKGNL